MMGEISLENYTFDAGHRIVGHKGKCARLHGHTYHIDVQVSGEIKPPGFVVDFGDIKSVIKEWDHHLLLWEKDPIVDIFSVKDAIESSGIVILKFNPTAEYMAQDLADRIGIEFNLSWVHVVLKETPTAYARGHWSAA